MVQVRLGLIAPLLAALLCMRAPMAVAQSVVETFGHGFGGWTSSDGPASLQNRGGALYNLVFLVEGASGFVAADGMRVQEGDFFIVEVSFDAPPEQTPLVVDLEWDGADRGLSVALNRFGGSGTVYRRDPLVMDSKGSVTYGVKN